MSLKMSTEARSTVIGLDAVSSGALDASSGTLVSDDVPSAGELNSVPEPRAVQAPSNLHSRTASNGTTSGARRRSFDDDRLKVASSDEEQDELNISMIEGPPKGERGTPAGSGGGACRKAMLACALLVLTGLGAGSFVVTLGQRSQMQDVQASISELEAENAGLTAALEAALIGGHSNTLAVTAGQSTSSVAPTEVPTTGMPSAAPTGLPTTGTPSAAPTGLPTTGTPSAAPTGLPTTGTPSAGPTPAPTLAPSAWPTSVPSVQPSGAPTPAPSAAPTAVPTIAPTAAPTEAPTALPTEAPTALPSEAPTALPTEAPITMAPTLAPSTAPTAVPTIAPTATPTGSPTPAPTPSPTAPTHCWLPNAVAYPTYIMVYQSQGWVTYPQTAGTIPAVIGANIKYVLTNSNYECDLDSMSETCPSDGNAEGPQCQTTTYMGSGVAKNNQFGNSPAWFRTGVMYGGSAVDQCASDAIKLKARGFAVNNVQSDAHYGFCFIFPRMFWTSPVPADGHNCSTDPNPHPECPKFSAYTAGYAQSDWVYVENSGQFGKIHGATGVQVQAPYGAFPSSFDYMLYTIAAYNTN